ncbi:hypothetical protein JEM67_26295 [Serratia sp. PAMC26656]|uniref:hypothetical protein n=1 Tax=Serratia sp. PAMC26656 TaxID=2775909 RepID=UPI0018F559C6|nr:hypothetical protein [Serratia sp. PAMC26656]MBJ7893517.1 hypothetical protein [Serratia sp. PAMC26656]
MRLSKKGNYKKTICIAVSVLSVLIIAGMSYLMFDFHTVPECKAVVKIIRPIDGEKKENVILINLVSSGFRETTFMINGHANGVKGTYTLSRMIEADYKYRGGYYYFTVKKMKKQPADNAGQDDVSQTLPIINSKYFLLKIEMLNTKNYVFSGNRAPAFICTKT